MLKPEFFADQNINLVIIGAVPDTELAEAAGPLVDDGVLADERLRTSRPAAGLAAHRYTA